MTRLRTATRSETGQDVMLVCLTIIRLSGTKLSDAAAYRSAFYIDYQYREWEVG